MTDLAHLRQLEERLDRLGKQKAPSVPALTATCSVRLPGRPTPLDELAEGRSRWTQCGKSIGEKYKGTFRARIEGRGAGDRRNDESQVHGRAGALRPQRAFLTSACMPGCGHRLVGHAADLHLRDRRLHLNAARLSLDFARRGRRLADSRFRHRELFSRPVDAWNATAALPVPLGRRSIID